MSKDSNKNNPKKSTLTRVPPGSKLDNVLDILRHIESSDISGIRATNSEKKQKETGQKFASTGYGYYQILGPTLEDINKKVIADGHKPLSLNTREEQHEAGRRLVIDYDEFLRNDMGIKNPTIADYYGVHFNGKAGYKRIKRSSQSDNIGSHVTSDAKKANPELYGGSIANYDKLVNDKIKSAQSSLKKESANRKSSLYKEKIGFDNGTSTPLDLRKGEYRGDGKESWNPNKFAYNGTKLGDQKFDYIVSKTDGKANVIKANSNKPTDIEGDYKAIEYDYLKNIYDPSLDSVDSNDKNKNTYQLEGIKDYNGNPGFGAELYKINQIDNIKPQNINYDRARRDEMAQKGTALYSNPNNPGSSIGNLEHLKIDVNGKAVGIDQLPMQVDSAITQAQDLLAANPTIPRNNAQQQYELGGDMNEGKPRGSFRNRSRIKKANEEAKNMIRNADGDTVVENAFEFIDPTGISSWDDIYRTLNDGKRNTTPIEFMGALPFTGKFAKAVMASKSVKPAGKVLSTTPFVTRQLGNASDAENITTKYKLGGDMNNTKVKNQNNDSLISFDAGGSHEENPLGGIPQNVNPDGTQNTVEEGETKHKDYVFSDSITILPSEAEELMLPEDIEGMTYADASKFLNKALEENENDPIVKRTVERQLENLKAGNEKARLKLEEQQLADQEYEAKLQADKIAEEQNANQGNVPSEGSGSENFSPTGEVNQSVPQQFSLDENMAPNINPNEQLLENDSLPQQFRLGGKMLFNGGYDDGIDPITGYQLTDNNVISAFSDDNQLTSNTYSSSDGVTSNSNTSYSDIGSATKTVAGTAGSTGQAVGGMVSGGLQMKEAFSLKDKVERGEKIDKGQVALKGAASGATTGAAIGSVIPGLGTVIGGAAGAVIGGVSGLIVGNNAQKKSENRRNQLDTLKIGSATSDFRTGSGYKEGDVKEFLGGGDLRDPYRGTGITYSNFDDQDYYDKIMNPMNFSLDGNNATDNDNAIYDDTTLDDMVIDVNKPKSTSNEKKKQGDKEKKAFSLPGGNVLKYAGLYGAYDQMKRWEDKPNWEESYVSSGLRYDPQFVDENLIANQIKAAGRTTDRIIQDNANGSGAAARAGLIASAGKTGEALSDAYIKALEFNAAQKQFALQNDNQLLDNRDAIINKQTENNMANAQAEYRLEQSARNNWYNSLAEFGKQRENETITENISKYDRFGNRVGNSRFDQLMKQVIEYYKNNSNTEG